MFGWGRSQVFSHPVSWLSSRFVPSFCWALGGGFLWWNSCWSYCWRRGSRSSSRVSSRRVRFDHNCDTRHHRFRCGRRINRWTCRRSFRQSRGISHWTHSGYFCHFRSHRVSNRRTYWRSNIKISPTCFTFSFAPTESITFKNTVFSMGLVVITDPLFSGDLPRLPYLTAKKSC